MKLLFAVSRACLIVSILLPVCSYAQTVAITSPANKALIQQVSGTANIMVSADGTDLPVGGGIEFILDMGTSGELPIKDFTSPYGCVYESIGLGEHTIDAYVIDSNGDRLTAHDQKTQIGIGDIVIAFGDSITRGENDNIYTDNWSADGRTGPQIDIPTGLEFGGFEPILNDLLTSARGYPHLVVNAGLSGEKSSGGKTRVASLLAQYPTAKIWLVAYGTNDANSGISPGTFSSNLQSIISQIKTAIPNAVIYIPRIFYFNENDSDYPRVVDYNSKVGDLVRNNAGVNWGADHETLFRGNHMTYNHSTNTPGTWLDPYVVHHPNGLGVQKMAMLWKMAIIDRAFLVSDGIAPTMGGAWADKIYISGLSGIGLSENNLLTVVSQDSQTELAPPGTSYASGGWSLRLALTGATGFNGNSLTATVLSEQDTLPPLATRWEQEWLSLDQEILATMRVQYPDKPNYYLLTATLTGPGQVAPVLDVTPPTTQAVSNPLQPDGSNGWYVTPPEVSISSVDSSGQPVLSVYRHWDSEPDVVYDMPLTPGPNTHTLYYHSVDQSGNVEGEHSTVFKLDSTPPTQPVVVDNVHYAREGQPINISWSSQDEESGVSSYMYAIGTNPDTTDVVEWTNSSDSSLTWTPTDAPGKTYYFSVKAVNNAGLISSVGVTDGVSIPVNAATIADAKKLADGTPVQVHHVVVTASQPGLCAVEEHNRSAGMKVICSTPAARGSDVTVTGKKMTISGESMIVDAEMKDVLAHEEIKPLGMTNSGINGLGLCPAGMLVKTWGKVEASGNGWIKISDDPGFSGIYVSTRYLSIVPVIDKFVTVTGIISNEEIDGFVKPVLVTREQQDITTID